MTSKKLNLALALIFLVSFIAQVSAGVYYHYNTYTDSATLYIGERPSYNYHYTPRYYSRHNSICYDYDYEDLRWEKNPVCTWVENGDGWKEEYRRARAVVWVTNSYDARYNALYGQSSGEAFYYADESSTDNPSDWRNKPAYDPRIYGSNGDNYYVPRYDYESGTYNWRY